MKPVENGVFMHYVPLRKRWRCQLSVCEVSVRVWVRVRVIIIRVRIRVIARVRAIAS